MLTGRFFFTLTSSGNLLGEYSNNVETVCLTECANRIVDKNTSETDLRDFVGDYNTVWREPKGKAVSAKLKITRKQNCCGIFELKWLQGQTIAFHGEGMLFNDALIGDYHE